MSVDELLVRLRDPDPRLRRLAAAALDDVLATPEIEQALRDAARDPDAKVRKTALHSLSCVHCKPDGCLAPAAIDIIIDALLHDRSVRVRRWAAGVTMWGQAGRSERMVAAHREVLATSDDRVLRERAATFLASCEIPKGDRPHREWIAEWQPRFEELLAA
jgi:HEAT repeat protein